MTLFLILVFIGIIGSILLISIPILFVGYFAYIFFMETSMYEVNFLSWFHNSIVDTILSKIPFSKTKVIFQDKKSLDENKQVFYGLHPHGLVAQGRILHMIIHDSDLRSYFSKSYQGVHSILFRIPVLRELLLLGKCVPAHEKFMDKLIEKGNSVAIFPGGSREVKYCSDVYASSTDYLYLRNRKGFIRMAIKHNLPLVPIYFWNEQERFQYTPNAIFDKINKIIAILTGYTMNLNLLQIFCPKNIGKLLTLLFGESDHCVYVGKPVTFTRDESIDVVHARYIKAVEELYALAKRDKNSDRKIKIM